MVASDLYALKGLWLKGTLQRLKKRKLKNEAKLWVIYLPWTPSPPLPPPPNPQVAKEVFGSFKVSHIKNNEIVLPSLTVFARKRDLKISLTRAP